MRTWMLWMVPIVVGCGGADEKSGDDTGEDVDIQTDSGTDTAPVVACGGGEHGADGAWLGTLQQPDGVLSELTLTISDDAMVAMEVNGAAQSITAVIEEPVGSYHRMVLSDGRDAGLIRSGTHAVLIASDGSISALECGADSLAASYTQADLEASWAGASIVTDFDDYLQEEPIDMDIDAAGVLDFEVAGYPIDGQVVLDSSEYGRYTGTFTVMGMPGEVTMFLAPSKQFACALACNQGSTFPNDCAISALSR